MAKASRQYKSPGRAPGSTNLKTAAGRTARLGGKKVSKGFLKVLDLLEHEMKCSKTQVLHIALRDLALQQFTEPKHLLLIKEII